MAQPPKQGIPASPANTGTNIHGQPNPPPGSDQEGHPQGQQGQTGPHPTTHAPGQVNIHGQAPKPHMAPTEESPKALGDNTKAEMDAGKENLAQYAKRNDAEHEAGRHANESRQK